MLGRWQRKLRVQYEGALYHVMNRERGGPTIDN
jgi:hypothetical protein